MRFLGIGDCNELGALYWRLQKSGHEVRVAIADSASRDIYRGLLSLCDDWRPELLWIKEAGKDGVILFEYANQGALQDTLRQQGFQVVGGSSFGDKLEQERSYGQKVLLEHGLQVLKSNAFDSFESGLHFIRENPRRYVLKFDGALLASTRNYIGQCADGRDMIEAIAMQARRWPGDIPPNFILMEHVEGVEVGVGAFFDGYEFLKPANLDWEHKRFFPADLGELTGEMGTVATYRNAETLFDATLGRLTHLFRQAGHVGYVNLNTIINAQGIWPLEFTCRFGYPGFAVLGALHKDGWDGILQKLFHRHATLNTYDGFSVAVALTVPPFPYADGYERLSKGLVVLTDELTEDEQRNIHYAEVTMEGEQMLTAGSIGYIAAVTGRGSTIEQARHNAYSLITKITIPNMRYRHDIGLRFTEQYQILQSYGWLGYD